jgi:hypothetical protein
LISYFDFKGSLVNDWIAGTSQEDLKSLIGKEISDSNNLWIIKDINHDDVYLAEISQKNIELPQKKFPIKFIGLHTDRHIYIEKTDKNLLNKINQFLGIQDNAKKLLDLGFRNLYYMIYFKNLSSILQNGILSRNEVIRREISFEDVSNKSVQEKRHDKVDEIYHRPIHEYVPLYYLSKTPMLYSLQEMQMFMLFFVINTQKLLSSTLHIFSDGNATNHESVFSNNIPDDLQIFKIIKDGFWSNYIDGRRKIHAEVLVYPKVEIAFIDKIVCFNDDILNKIKNTFPALDIPIVVDKSLYFNKSFI